MLCQTPGPETDAKRPCGCGARLAGTAPCHLQADGGKLCEKAAHPVLMPHRPEQGPGRQGHRRLAQAAEDHRGVDHVPGRGQTGQHTARDFGIGIVMPRPLGDDLQRFQPDRVQPAVADDLDDEPGKGHVVIHPLAHLHRIGFQRLTVEPVPGEAGCRDLRAPSRTFQGVLDALAIQRVDQAGRIAQQQQPVTDHPAARVVGGQRPTDDATVDARATQPSAQGRVFLDQGLEQQRQLRLGGRQGIEDHADTYIRAAATGREQPVITRKALTAEEQVAAILIPGNTIKIGADRNDPVDLVDGVSLKGAADGRGAAVRPHKQPGADRVAALQLNGHAIRRLLETGHTGLHRSSPGIHGGLPEPVVEVEPRDHPPVIRQISDARHVTRDQLASIEEKRRAGHPVRPAVIDAIGEAQIGNLGQPGWADEVTADLVAGKLLLVDQGDTPALPHKAQGKSRPCRAGP